MTQKKDQPIKFNGELGQYQVIVTDDGTPTLHSEYFNETCHSLCGAYKETVYNYIDGCKIINNFNNCHILEVGFGLGIGYKATVESLNQNKTKPQNFTYVSTELDASLINWAKDNLSIEYEGFPELKDLKKINSFTLVAKKNNYSLIILIGDARKTLPQAVTSGLVPKATAIYQDPFSPKRNPSLWTKEWFVLLKKASAINVTLATYSASTSIRKTLVASGWSIANRKGFGAKKSSTTAFLNKKSDEETMKKLDYSSIAPLQD